MWERRKIRIWKYILFVFFWVSKYKFSVFENNKFLFDNIEMFMVNVKIINRFFLEVNVDILE